jgi:aryl-alcohol dehydrogenase-like predicted oxidoreductase
VTPGDDLRRVPLGSTDMAISRVGFGAWAIGGGGWKNGWGDQDAGEAIAAMRYAVEQGVNWIDTAPVYGLGRSEEIVGRAFAGLPDADRPLIFTKCGLTFDAERPDDGPYNVLEPASIRREVEDSLRRLQVDRIDLYQVHWPPNDGTPLEEYWATMLALKGEGKVRAIGLSNHDVEQIRAAERIGHVDTLQPQLSMIHREAGADVIPLAADNGTAVIVYSPMQSGLLTGAMSAERVAALPADDWRASADDFTGDNLRRNLALADALRPVAERLGVSVGAVAVAWALSWPGVTGAIVGARSPRQVDGWLPAASLELGAAELMELTGAIESTGAGDGPLPAGLPDATGLIAR